MINYAIIKLPEKPFPEYKWKWATVQPTESLNDPVVLLGVLERMYKLEGTGLRYSSSEFSYELMQLERDLQDSVGVNLASRGGERNLIRNSGQYWKAVGLIPADSRGVIKLTDFGRKVADGEITQSEFAAIEVRSFKLPNPYTSTAAEKAEWKRAHLEIHPLMLILQITRELSKNSNEIGWITTNELADVVIPLAGANESDPVIYAECLRQYRENKEAFQAWPDCTPSDNDRRMVREYLLFLDHYGFLIADNDEGFNRFDVRFCYNKEIDEEISDILSDEFSGQTSEGMLAKLRAERIVSSIDTKRIRIDYERPDQAAFRRALLNLCQRCVITNATMPEIIQAAHIKPHKYNGPESADNGFAMRMDIHRLYDTNHLRISPDGVVAVSDRARADYGSIIPPRIVIPEYVNIEYVRWRWENYVGLC